MRSDKRRHTATELTPAAGYHGSRFDKVWYYTSDRRALMNTLATKIIKGVGLEIETETALFGNTWGAEYGYFNVLSKIVFAPLGDDFVRIEHDGSLGHGDTYTLGAEVVTQVASKAAWRNKYAALKEIYDTLFPVFKISCAASGACGMHANISQYAFGTTVEKQTEAIRKLYWLINKDDTSWRLLARCFNRPASRFDNNSPYDNNSCHYWQRMYCPSMDWVKTFDPWHVHDHACALNCTHLNDGATSSRVEVRLMGGQDNYHCFRNSLEVLFHLLDRVTEISWEKTNNWVEVFKGCNQYVLKRLDRCRLEGYLSEEDYNAIKATVKPLDLEIA